MHRGADQPLDLVSVDVEDRTMTSQMILIYSWTSARRGLQVNRVRSPTVNNDWIRQKLEEFLALCQQYEAESGPGGDYNAATMKPIQDKIDDAVPTVQRIIGQLDPSLLSDGFGTAWHIGGLSETTRTTRRAPCGSA
jgi:hypothetical protein